MKNSVATVDRRSFLKAGLVGSLAWGGAGSAHRLLAEVTKPQKALFGGLKLGMASYTFRKFTLEQAIEMSKQAGAVSISLKDVHLPYKSTPAERQEARRKVEAAGLFLASGGVIPMKNNESEVRDLFEYA